jgi:hypothetical protein
LSPFGKQDHLQTDENARMFSIAFAVSQLSPDLRAIDQRAR